MSNLESAKAAIEAELAHAREGFSYYQSRIVALQKMLSQLESVAGGDGLAGAGGRGRPGRKAGAGRLAKATGKAARGKRGRRTGSADDGGKRLPFTGGNFWTNLVSEKPQSVSDILHAAAGKLDFTPTEEELKKLAGRMTFALNALVKDKTIQDSGKGRERRYFKK